ncbi:hypothetical protein [Jiella pelagia]|uniref:Uncharacterized protein n=1 Tax=Jiella pelagia TaxID=2986949 RepID=A0ABY7C4L1_9HYPH|nr:hypothetical protein [Jiella pelagia]WAP70643.1 hypothetical protein OH818_11845 [Jiella pelagia]
MGDIVSSQGNLGGALAKADPSNTEWQRDLIVFTSNLMTVYELNGQADQACKSLKFALAVSDALLRKFSDHPEWLSDRTVLDQAMAERGAC